MIKQKDAKITVDTMPTVFANESHVDILFQSLISNAIKYCQRKPEVRVRYKEEINHYVFSVEDNGIGIDEHYWEYIFQIFNRLHSKKDFPGNGMGLTMCKRIINNLNGSIWLESQKGIGSKFFFRVPKGG